MNILVITDNVFLWKEFRKIVEEMSFEKVNFSYGCSAGSLEMFAGMKGNTPFEVNVKTDYPEIIDKYQLVFSMHCKQLFPREMVEGVKCINIHPGLNPNNRGWFPQVFAILNKLPHGATIHEMDAKIDHGPIIAQEVVPVYDWDTSRTVYERVQNAELSLVRSNLDMIIRGAYTAHSPGSTGNLNYKKDFEALCELDMDKKVSMKQAIDILRALTHEPYQNAFFITDTGEKVFVQLVLDKREDDPDR